MSVAPNLLTFWKFSTSEPTGKMISGAPAAIILLLLSGANVSARVKSNDRKQDPVGLAHAIVFFFELLQSEHTLYSSTALEFAAAYMDCQKLSDCGPLNFETLKTGAAHLRSNFGKIRHIVAAFGRIIRSQQSLLEWESRQVANMIEYRSVDEYHVDALNRLNSCLTEFESLNTTSSTFEVNLRSWAQSVLTNDNGANATLTDLHRSGIGESGMEDIFQLFATRVAKPDIHQSALWKTEAHADTFISQQTLLYGLWLIAVQLDPAYERVSNQTSSQIRSLFRQRFSEQLSKVRKVQLADSGIYRVPENQTVSIEKLCFAARLTPTYDIFSLASIAASRTIKWGLLASSGSDGLLHCSDSKTRLFFSSSMINVRDSTVDTICGLQLTEGFADNTTLKLSAKICWKQSAQVGARQANYFVDPETDELDFIDFPYRIVVTSVPQWHGWITGIGLEKVDNNTLRIVYRTNYYPPIVSRLAQKLSPMMGSLQRGRVNQYTTENRINYDETVGFWSAVSGLFRLNKKSFINQDMEMLQTDTDLPVILPRLKNIDFREAVQSLQYAISEFVLLKNWLKLEKLGTEFKRLESVKSSRIRQFVKWHTQMAKLIDTFEKLNISSENFSLETQAWFQTILNESSGANEILFQLHQVVVGNGRDTSIFAQFHNAAAKSDQLQSRTWKSQAFADIILSEQALAYGLYAFALQCYDCTPIVQLSHTCVECDSRNLLSDVREMWSSRAYGQYQVLRKLPHDVFSPQTNNPTTNDTAQICVVAKRFRDQLSLDVPAAYTLSVSKGSDFDSIDSSCALLGDFVETIYFSGKMLAVPNSRTQMICKVSIVVKHQQREATVMLRANVCVKISGEPVPKVPTLQSESSESPLNITAPFSLAPTQNPQWNGWITAIGLVNLNSHTVGIQMATDYFPSLPLNFGLYSTMP